MKIAYTCILLGCMLILKTSSAFAQQQPPETEAFRSVSLAGVPIDWTHDHIIFSSSSQNTQTLTNNQEDPRYWLQLLWRGGSQDSASIEAADAARIAAAQLSKLDERISREKDLEGDRGRDHDCDDFRTPRDRLHGHREPPMGFNNLYVSSAGGSQFCSGSAPKPIFEYNASSASGALNGAPALSLDGTMIAFVDTASVALGDVLGERHPVGVAVISVRKGAMSTK
jgi:hypothetical protein